MVYLCLAQALQHFTPLQLTLRRSCILSALLCCPPEAMQGSHTDHAPASLLVCSTPVPTVGGQAATLDSPHDYNFSTDSAKPASEHIKGPSALPFISSASRGSTTTFDGSFSTLVGGSAAASTSALALLPLLCRSGQQPSCSLSSPPFSALAGDGGSISSYLAIVGSTSLQF